MTIDPTIFKAYDIRGIFPDQMNAHVAELVGRALGDFLPTQRAVAVGRDMRVDSEELTKAVIKGLVEQGRDVIDIGLVTTEMAAFASGFYNLAGAAMITASHNPGQYNGIKLCAHEAEPIGITTGLKSIQTAVLAAKFKPAARPGTVTKRSIDADWIKHCLTFVDASKWPRYKIAVDAGNGMAGKVFPQVEQQVKVDVTKLFFELDGTFPNHPANPAVAANLADLVKAVKSGQLDLGIAFDGDGDRAFFVDETGAPLSASITAAILVQHFVKLHPGAAILYDLRMSKIVSETIRSCGGGPIRTPVGGGFIRPAIRAHQAVLACEGAGHYYFRDNYYSDSGLITALLIMDIMADKKQTLSQLAAPFRKYFDSGELSVDSIDQAAIFETVEAFFHGGIRDQLDGLTIDYGDWWFNLRSSNTEPLMRLNVEATTQAVMEQKRDEILKLIKT